MGFDVQQLVNKSVEIEIEIAGEKGVVHYDPTVITKARIESAEQGDEEFLDLFIALVRDWDVTDGGKTVPLTREALSPLPVILLRSVFMQILRESSAGQMGKVSPASSRRRAPQDRKAKTSTSRSGTATSRRRDTSE